MIFSAGALLALLGVAAGAFAAHALKLRLSPDALATFELAARYQMLHALALLANAGACERWPGRWPQTAALLLVLGTVLFSGSLYAISLGAPRWLAMLTPIGGIAWLAAWACLAATPWRRRT